MDDKAALRHTDALETLLTNMIAAQMALEGAGRRLDEKETNAICWLVRTCCDQLDEIIEKFNTAGEAAYPPAAA
jgi:hypothetical protein